MKDRKSGAARLRQSFQHAGEEARRQDLINATLDAVAETGLQGATVREIAKRAGVTPGLIRHYFENKELMFQAAYRQVVDNMFHMTSSAAEREPNAKASLKAYVASAFKSPMIEARNLTLWATFISQLSVDPALEAINRETYLVGRDRLEAYITQALRDADRRFAPGEPRALSIAVNGLIDGLWLEATMAAELFEEGELERIALAVVEGILGISFDKPPKGHARAPSGARSRKKP
ncbi:MAG: TetR family transcriptional regulator [Mesorhizobium sp.]|nr:MAG: TetR family transcriptional regulator [Mesorhizobium sp.]